MYLLQALQPLPVSIPAACSRVPQDSPFYGIAGEKISTSLLIEKLWQGDDRDFSLDLETTEWTDNMNLKAVKSHKTWEKCSAQLL